MSASGDWPVSGRSDSNPRKISMAQRKASKLAGGAERLTDRGHT
jgi:hypothetical protein